MCRDNPWKSGTTPHTNRNANIQHFRKVNGVTVIKVNGARYRNSLPLNGMFELVDPESRPQYKFGANRIEVKCLWFGVKPPTTYPNIIVPEESEIIENYSGKVACNIASTTNG